MFLEQKIYADLKTVLHPIRGPIGSAHMHEALAAGFGFPDHHALKSSLVAGELKEQDRAHISIESFTRRLEELDYDLGAGTLENEAAWNLATTALSFTEGDRAFSIIAHLPKFGQVVRLDPSLVGLRASVAAFQSACEKVWDYPRWMLRLPRHWQSAGGERVTREDLEIMVGHEHARGMTGADNAKCQALKALVGEEPTEFFSRVLIELKPYLPGFEGAFSPVHGLRLTPRGGLDAVCDIPGARHFPEIHFRYSVAFLTRSTKSAA
jgi:hypothetical protein